MIFSLRHNVFRKIWLFFWILSMLRSRCQSKMNIVDVFMCQDYHFGTVTLNVTMVSSVSFWASSSTCRTRTMSIGDHYWSTPRSVCVVCFYNGPKSVTSVVQLQSISSWAGMIFDVEVIDSTDAIPSYKTSVIPRAVSPSRITVTTVISQLTMYALSVHASAISELTDAHLV